MRLLDYFPFAVALALLVLSGVYHNVGFAVSAVVTLALIMSKATMADYLFAKQAKPAVPDEAKRKISDLEARITSIEAGIARRGF